jgi:hypothetical protein
MDLLNRIPLNVFWSPLEKTQWRSGMTVKITGASREFYKLRSHGKEIHDRVYEQGFIDGIETENRADDQASFRQSFSFWMTTAGSHKRCTYTKRKLVKTNLKSQHSFRGIHA